MSRASRVIASIPAAVSLVGAIVKLATTHEKRLSGLEASLAAEAARKYLDTSLAQATRKE